jgi:hypothetical protein
MKTCLFIISETNQNSWRENQELKYCKRNLSHITSGKWCCVPDKDPVIEAQRIVKAAQAKNVILRLLGGIAFRLSSPSALDDNLKRTYADIDLMGLRKQTKEIRNLFKDLGYEPRIAFNASHGHSRLIFNDLENNRRVDIFLNVFEMCHKFDFTDRLELSDLTLPLADLLLTKLQVVEITAREYKDVIAFLKDHELGEKDQDNMINVKYITKLASSDWGLWKTITVNLGKIESSLGSYGLSASDQALVSSRIVALKERLELEPKSLGWKARAMIGDRVVWYVLPEND